MRILLDMDELITDFVGGACRAWGADPEDVLAQWELGRWDMVLPLSYALGLPEVMRPEEFWRPLTGRRGRVFWGGLDRTPWAGELLDLVRGLTDDWYVVTSPARCPESYAGKAEWLYRYLGEQAWRRYVPFTDKHALAGPGVVLVDDREEAVARFVACGGRGILFPRHHNRLHPLKDDPLGYVRSELLLPRP